jgi:hypothetical protein
MDNTPPISGLEVCTTLIHKKPRLGHPETVTLKPRFTGPEGCFGSQSSWRVPNWEN